jgi:Protein of unknown function (DUF998)
MTATADARTSAPSTAAASRAPAMIGTAALAALAVGSLLVLLLQFIPPTNEISTIRRTISEYALTANKWIFDVGVILVAVASAMLFAMHVLRRTLPLVSGATLFGALWTVSLLVIVAFPKTNWAIGPSTGGTVHRIASMIGFIGLPIGLLLASRRVFPDSTPWRWATRLLAITSLLWFGVILGGVAMMLAGSGPWWQILPLGLVERLMALNEIFAIAVLAVPLLRVK